MKLTVFSSCECCFLANVYCGCLAFCPLCFYHPEGKGVGHGGEVFLLREKVQLWPLCPLGMQAGVLEGLGLGVAFLGLNLTSYLLT